MSGPTSGPSSANAALEWLRAQREPAPETVREAARRWRDHHRVHFVGAEELLAGVAQRLVAMGMPLVQCSTSLLPLHPEVYAWNYVWRRDEGVVCHVRTHAYIAGQPGDSPFAAIKRGEGPIRLRLEPPPAQLAALPPELRSSGATDLYVIPLTFSDARRSFFYAMIDRPGGFGDDEIARLAELAPILTIRVELASAHAAAAALLETYLGANAAHHVLSGAFKRGTAQPLRAVIWYCDMRGFTSLVDARPIGQVVPLLDRYFEAIGGPVEDSGGEILKFIGDAVLAVFPIEGDDEATPCARALEAARFAVAALDALNRERTPEPPLELGIALHLGEVMYGNIGARTRLDFTVIGAVVNEAARVEGLCKELGVPLLVTEAVRAAAPGLALSSLGRHALRGVIQPVELFTPAR